jgi:hypothetical protein
MVGKKVKQALRRIVAEAHLEGTVRLRGSGRAAGKEVLFMLPDPPRG